MSDDRTVAIVVDPEYGDRLSQLEAAMPVWAVKSPTNARSWSPGASVHENSALFSVEALDAREENVVNALVDVRAFRPDLFAE